jgi:anaerobic selenocysteine-containing dehydrogenase
MNSTFGHRDAVDRQTAKVHMHRADAAQRSIRNGDMVRAFNDRGSLLAVAEVALADGDAVVPPGVVRVPSTRWNKRSPDCHGVNALTSGRLTDIGGGPTFYNCLIEIERCGD